MMNHTVSCVCAVNCCIKQAWRGRETQGDSISNSEDRERERGNDGAIDCQMKRKMGERVEVEGRKSGTQLFYTSCTQPKSRPVT